MVESHSVDKGPDGGSSDGGSPDGDSPDGGSPLTRSPRLIGWGLTVLAYVVGYLFWIIGRDWWWPAVIVTCAVLVGVFAANCYLAVTRKKYDLFLAALLAVAAPFVVIAVAFGCCFSGPPV